jgi:8-oxo-dGTP pyrophosphatase MutT (NUDIX family)
MSVNSQPSVLFTDVVSRLERALRTELPGAAAHQLLAPRPRREWPTGFDQAHIRRAAGLLLIYPVNDRAHVVLTVRADALRHGGQVSLPGGVVEPGETLEQAALREAHEEVGLSADGVRVLGALTPLDIPVSGFRLHPIVASRDSRPRLRPADGEVARILEVGLEELIEPGHLRTRELLLGGASITVPGIHVHGQEIWGATAMVLAEFLALLGWRPQELK